MRSFFAFTFLMLAGLTAALAQEESAPVEGASVQAPESHLDTLFAELRRASNESAAERIAGRILEEWSQSGSATIDLLMQWSMEAMEGEEYAVAMDLLDQVVTLQPAYAEGWNRRATLHFIMNNYAKSMADIERTLRLEPRHFGALGGLAAIMQETGRKELALEAYQRLLEVYPMLREAQTELGRLADELTGQRI